MRSAPSARVAAVAEGSPAERAGLRAGDELLTLNGEAVRDVIRYHIQADEPRVELEVRRGGLERSVVVEKAAGTPLGLDLATAVFDQVRTCDNHCPFCFIYQLPKGMRRSLYLKDDDYRLSFLYGNFTTLTRFTEADLERVVTERLSPLYVSIHATDPDLRARLLRNRRGATSLRWLAALLAAGVEVHGQIVVCPGINDGDALDDTLLGILDRFPEIATVGVVPLGVSDHTTEPDMRAHTETEARRVVDLVDEWQVRYARALGRRVVYASDEYHLLAGRPFPPGDAYDGFAQHENGIGMARTFVDEVQEALGRHTAGLLPGVAPEARDGGAGRGGFFQWVEGAPAEGYRAPALPPALPPSLSRAGSCDGSEALPARAVDQQVSGAAPRRRTRVLSGELGARVLAPLVPGLTALAGTPVEVQAVTNRFFGGNIGVTGLLTGADVAAALADVEPGTRVLLPDVVLSNGRFLDGASLADLPVAVEVVGTDGESLVRALAPASS